MSGDSVAGEGLIARLHPRTRLIATLVAVVFITALHDIAVLSAALVAAFLLAWLAHLPWGELRHRLLHVEGFLIVLLVLLPFTVPGETLFSLGPFSATSEGVTRAVTAFVKVNVCTLVVFALVGTLDPVRIGQAAESLGAPDRLVSLFLFTVRYVAVFRAESTRLGEAMRARGFVPGSNLHTWRTYGNLAGMMMVRSLERAQRVDEAMRCRGFSGRVPAPPLGAAKQSDFAFATVFASVMVCLLVMEFVV